MKKQEQVAAITRIRKDIEKCFPHFDFRAVEQDLISWVEVEDDEEVEYDKKRGEYIIEGVPECKVCETRVTLTAIPTQVAKFYLCRTCLDNIAKAETLSAVK